MSRRNPNANPGRNQGQRPLVARLLDFVHDQFTAGRRFRILNLVDDVTRECPAAIPDTSISGKRELAHWQTFSLPLTSLIATRGKPGMIVSDNSRGDCRRAFRWRIGRGRSRAKISSAWWWTPPCRRRRLRLVAEHHFAAEVLKIRVLHPPVAQHLVREIVHVLENE